MPVPGDRIIPQSADGRKRTEETPPSYDGTENRIPNVLKRRGISWSKLKIAAKCRRLSSFDGLGLVDTVSRTEKL